MSAAVRATAPSQARLLTVIAGFAVVAGVAVVAGLVLGDPDRRVEIERIVQSPFGLLGLFAFSALSSATLFLPVPGMALTVLAATVADPWLVGIAAGSGQAIGELTGYLAGATGTAVVSERLAASRTATWMRRYGAGTIFVLAAVPNPIFDMAGLLAGAVRMPLVRYLGAAGAGKIIRNTMLAFATVHGATLLASVAS
jgi:membrane protein YqaA with SNARE-associated domain